MTERQLGGSLIADRSRTGAAVVSSLLVGLVAASVGPIGGVGMFLLLALLVGSRRPSEAAMVSVFAVAYGNVEGAWSAMAGSAPPIVVALLVSSLLSILGEAGARPLRSDGVRRWLLLAGPLLAAALASTLANGVTDAAWTRLGETVLGVAMVAMAVAVMREEESLRLAAWALVLVAAALALVSAVQAAFDSWDRLFWGFGRWVVPIGAVRRHRVAGPFGDPNFYAQALLPAMSLAADRALSERRWLLRLTAIAALALTGAAVVLSYSRGAFLGSGVLVVLWLLRLRPSWRLIVPSAAVLLVLALVAAPFTVRRYARRVETLLSGAPGLGNIESESSFRGRAGEMLAAVRMFSDRPLLGVGWGRYEERYLDYSWRIGLDRRGVPRRAHSLYLEVLAESGLVGLAALALLLWGVVAGLVRAGPLRASAQDRGPGQGRERHHLLPPSPGLPFAVASGIVGYLVAAAFLHQGFPGPFWVLLSIAMVTLTVSRAECRAGRRHRGRKALATG